MNLTSFRDTTKKCIESEFIDPEASSSSGLHLSFYCCVVLVETSSKTSMGADSLV